MILVAMTCQVTLKWCLLKVVWSPLLYLITVWRTVNSYISIDDLTTFQCFPTSDLVLKFKYNVKICLKSTSNCFQIANWILTEYFVSCQGMVVFKRHKLSISAFPDQLFLPGMCLVTKQQTSPPLSNCLQIIKQTIM